MTPHYKKGLTLIEMSIVLIVIAMLVGGITVGQHMIRNARLQNVVKEMQRYVQAVGNFRDKYQALPGDFGDATTLWGNAAACLSRLATCTTNGDGNGRITSQGNLGTFYEQFSAWKHLTAAGMVEGYFTDNGAVAQLRTPGITIPSSQFLGAGWGLVTIPVGSVLNNENGLLALLPYVAGDVPPNTVLWFGGVSLNNVSNEQTPILQADEAQQIDEKVDDGIAGIGKVVSQVNSSGTACANAGGGILQYNLSSSGPVCALIFKTGL